MDDSPVHASGPVAIRIHEERRQKAAARFERRFRRRRKLLTAIDRLSAPVVRCAMPEIPTRPKTILIANGAHLGDAVMTTAMLPVLKSAFPGISIGVLAGTWGAPVFAGHPMVDKVHYLDHWWHDRGSGGVVKKIVRYLREWPRMRRELRSHSYEVAVDARVSLPNFVPLIWASGIPIRVGSAFGGFTSLLTHPVPYEYSGKNRLYELADLLSPLRLPPECFDQLCPSMPPTTPQAAREIGELLHQARLSNHPFRILHMCASIPERGWRPDEWRIMAELLGRDGAVLVFTGSGSRDHREIAAVTGGLLRCVNACDRLTWDGFVAAIRQAELVYSVDTVTAHIATAVDTPCVVVFGGMYEAEHFGPWGLRKVVVTNPVECAPCFQARGCSEMTCLLGLPARRVYEAGEALLQEARREGLPPGE